MSSGRNRSDSAVGHSRSTYYKLNIYLSHKENSSADNRINYQIHDRMRTSYYSGNATCEFYTRPNSSGFNNFDTNRDFTCNMNTPINLESKK